MSNTTQGKKTTRGPRVSGGYANKRGGRGSGSNKSRGATPPRHTTTRGGKTRGGINPRQQGTHFPGGVGRGINAHRQASPQNPGPMRPTQQMGYNAAAPLHGGHRQPQPQYNMGAPQGGRPSQAMRNTPTAGMAPSRNPNAAMGQELAPQKVTAQGSGSSNPVSPQPMQPATNSHTAGMHRPSSAPPSLEEQQKQKAFAPYKRNPAANYPGYPQQYQYRQAYQYPNQGNPQAVPQHRGGNVGNMRGHPRPQAQPMPGGARAPQPGYGYQYGRGYYPPQGWQQQMVYGGPSAYNGNPYAGASARASYGNTGYSQPHSAARPAAPRKSKAIPIIDPTTGKSINLADSGNLPKDNKQNSPRTPGGVLPELSGKANKGSNGATTTNFKPRLEKGPEAPSKAGKQVNGHKPDSNGAKRSPAVSIGMPVDNKSATAKPAVAKKSSHSVAAQFREAVAQLAAEPSTPTKEAPKEPAKPTAKETPKEEKAVEQPKPAQVEEAKPVDKPADVTPEVKPDPVTPTDNKEVSKSDSEATKTEQTPEPSEQADEPSKVEAKVEKADEPKTESTEPATPVDNKVEEPKKVETEPEEPKQVATTVEAPKPADKQPEEPKKVEAKVEVNQQKEEAPKVQADEESTPDAVEAKPEPKEPVAVEESTEEDKKPEDKKPEAPAPKPEPKVEETPVVAPVKKRKLKDILKAADKGEYSAASFDAYSDKPEPKKEQVKAPPKEEPKPEPKPEPKVEVKQEEDDDDWETMADSDFTLGDKAPAANTLLSTSSPFDAPAGATKSSDGRQMYSRDFMMQFQKLCTDQPEELKTDSIKNIVGTDFSRPQSSRRRNNDSGGWRNKHDRRGRKDSGGSWKTPRGKGKRGRRGPQERREPAEGEWNPRPKDMDDNMRLSRRVQVILNKLAKDNFEKLSQDILNIDIENETRLGIIINLVYDKAVTEPTYGELYAELCKKLESKTIDRAKADVKGQATEKDKDGKPGKPMDFRRLLLNRCQTEFENKKAAPKLDDSLTGEERLAVMEQAVKYRQRNIGNVKFIGQLYLQGMLMPSIMDFCLKSLLGDWRKPNEDEIENFCKLLTAIGERLNKTKYAKRMPQFFDTIQKLISQRLVCQRIIFMLEDLVELRKNNWVDPKKKPSSSTSMRKTNSRSTQLPSMSRRNDRNEGSSRGPRRSNSNRGNTSDGSGWTTIASSGGKRNYQQRGDVREKVNNRPQRSNSQKSGRKRIRGSSKNQQFRKKEFVFNPDTFGNVVQDIISKDNAGAVAMLKTIPNTHYPLFLKTAVSLMVEMKRRADAQKLLKLFEHIASQSLFKKDHWHKGLKMLIDNFPEFRMDTPTAWKHVANTHAHVYISGGFTDVQFLQEALKPYIKTKESQKYIFQFFTRLYDVKGLDYARDVLNKEKVDLKAFMADPSELEDLIVEFELDGILESDSDNGAAEEPKETAAELLKQGKSADAVIEWITKNVSPMTRKDSAFITNIFDALTHVLDERVGKKPKGDEVAQAKDEVAVLKEYDALVATLLKTEEAQAALCTAIQIYWYRHSKSRSKERLTMPFEHYFSQGMLTTQGIDAYFKCGMSPGKLPATPKIKEWASSKQ